MNEKLHQCVGLVELLRDHLKDKHHTRLELMIIILIMIEVCHWLIFFGFNHCVLPLVLQHFWPGMRKSVWPVKLSGEVLACLSV